MTGKLIKYEVRSMVRQMGLLWAALPLLSIIWVFTHSLSKGSAELFMGPVRPAGLIAIIQTISTFIYATVFVIMIVATVVIILQRFYKGLLRDEGYLMHTLPVKPWQLITSKGIVAFLVILVSGIVAAVSVFILVIANSSWDNFISGFTQFMDALKDNPQYIIYGLEIVILLVLSILKSIYQVYASMAIGQLASNHKLLMSAAAYIGISTVLSLTLGVLMLPINDKFVSFVSDFLSDMSAFAAGQFVVLAFFLVVAVQLVLFHVITERLLMKKLNLE